MATKRAAIYARQSLDKTGEGLGVARQLEDCRALVSKHGWTPSGEYVDNDVSASTGKARPQYRAMLDAVEAGRVDTIVSWAPDRLARRPRDLEDLLDLVEGRGISLATVSGDVDLSTPYGRTTARIFGAIARQEVEQKGARQARANLQRAQAGHTSWTRRPFGYERDAAGEIVIVQPEAKELRLAAKAVLDGHTLASIVRGMSARGVTTSVGQPFTVTALRRALLNPRVSGQAIYRGVPVGEGKWAAILEPELQERVGRVLTDPSRRTQTNTNRRFLLSGLVRCGRCDEPMFASPMGKPGAYSMVYKCRTAHLTRRLEPVDEVVVAAVLARLGMPDARGLLVSSGPDADDLQARSVALRAQLDSLAELLAEGTLTVAGVRKASKGLQEQLEDVEHQRRALTSGDSLAELIDSADVEGTWSRMSLNAQRAAVETLLLPTLLPVGKGVRFSPEQVRIDWRVP